MNPQTSYPDFQNPRLYKTEKYSIAFYPDFNIREFVRIMKQNLKTISGEWFHSVNSEAHLTISEFFATPQQLAIIDVRLRELCCFFKSFTAVVDRFDSFDHGSTHTAFLAPNKISSQQFVDVMHKINEKFPISPASKVNIPHMSIGRKLSPRLLQIASDIWENRRCNIHFVCDRVVLRRLDLNAGQFIIEKEYLFRGVEEWTLF